MTAICFYVGASTLFIIGLSIIYCVAYFIRESIINLRWKYKYKHRFDKKPIAKCYCIDCEHHAVNSNYCKERDTYFPDEWFCKDAKPKSAK